FCGNYTIKIEDCNKENQENMENIDVCMTDFKFRIINKEIYDVWLKNKINFLLRKIANGENLTQREQKDIQIILLPYLKIEKGRKILSVDPVEIKDINILFLLLSQGYIREACEGLKEKKLSPRENIRLNTLLNIASHHNHRNKFEDLVK